MKQQNVTMFVVYENPTDYPGQFVVRRWRVATGRVEAEVKPLAVVGTLDEARAAVPTGLKNIGRKAEVDPAICEVWL